MGLQIDSLLIQAEFLSQIIPVKRDCAGADAQELGNLLAGLSLPNEIGYLHFPVSQIQMPG